MNRGHAISPMSEPGARPMLPHTRELEPFDASLPLRAAAARGYNVNTAYKNFSHNTAQSTPRQLIINSTRLHGGLR